jgi:peptidoglycan-associated lipoprotein
MDRGFSRWLLVPVVAVACLALAAGCKSAPRDETPVTEAPTFETTAPPAERVPDDTGDFGTPTPDEETLADSYGTSADVLNQQGVLKRVHFDFDKFDLKSEAIRTLGENAALIREHSQYDIRIEGHCDERGTVEYNLALGEKRARSARDYLVSLGIPASRLRVISYGKERPFDPGHNEVAWAMNRRADFKFLAE